MALDKDHVITAWISLVLLGMLIFITSSRLVAWRSLKTRGDLKKTFHRVLLGTGLLELPLWFLCVLPSVQEDSFTNYPKHPLFPLAYACHCLALPGYFACTAIIVVLWSDLLKSLQFIVPATRRVRKEQHFFVKLVSCQYGVRSFFGLLMISYTAMEIIVAISIVVKIDWRQQQSSFESNRVYQASIIVDPVVLVAFLGGVVFYGTKLQSEIAKVKLGERMRMRLWQLRVFIIVIIVCFMLRAVIILSLFFKVSATPPLLGLCCI
jgi:hypothetical protein